MIFYAIWRVWVFLLWFGVMFAICSVIITVMAAAILLAVVYGLASTTRTPASTLRALVANTEAGIAHVQALR